jgi:phenylacetate-CoA ligase
MKPRHLLHLYNLQRAKRLRREQLEEIQGAKLRRLLRHAYDRVPYYRKLFDSAGLKPEQIQSVQDLPKIPATSRKTMHELSLSDRIARGIDPGVCKLSATSGTTGIPLKIYFTRHDSTLKNLSWARAFLSWGMKPWHTMLAFIGLKDVKEKRSWYERLGLWRRDEISTWAGPAAWIDTIRRQKPHALIGYVMTLRILAEALDAAGIADVLPKLVFHSSAILDPGSRRYLETVFGCHVVDLYGSDEAGCIAWECKDCPGYHISADTVIIELLRNGNPVGPGEEGEVFITNLHSYAMPFIRYAQCDVAVLSPEQPRCGCGLPLLERVVGRTDDFVVLSDGTKISPHPLYHCIDHVGGVRSWRITQDSLESITVELELKQNMREHTCDAVEKNLAGLLGERIDINIKVVDAMPVDPSRKFRSVNSPFGEMRPPS